MSLMKKFQEQYHAIHNAGHTDGRVLATLPAPAKSAEAPGLLVGQQLNALVDATLADSLATLSGLTSVERKAAFKRDRLLPQYEAYVQRLLAADSRHDLLGYWLVWLFDAGKVAEAMAYAKTALEKNIPLPERFKSTMPFFIASQLMTWAEVEQTAGRTPEPYFSDLFTQLEAAPEVWNVDDTLFARYYRMRGLLAYDLGDLAAAQAALTRALELGAKVKTVLAEVEKKLAAVGMEEGDTASGSAFSSGHVPKSTLPL